MSARIDDTYEMHESNGGVLLMPLSEVQLGPCDVDVDKAMADGRHRIRRRRVITATAAMAAVTAVALAGAFVVADRSASPTSPASRGASGTSAISPAGSGPSSAGAAIGQCSVEKLTYPQDASEVNLRGIDPTGKYFLGYVSRKQAGSDDPVGTPMIWTDGKPTAVTAPAGRVLSLYDVTSKGVAVGELAHTKVSPDPAVAIVVRNGQVTRLPTARGEDVASAINEAGVIVGSTAATFDAVQAPVKWTSSTANPVELKVPEGFRNGSAQDIDEDGTIVGTVDNGRKDRHPYVWFPDGTGKMLVPPAKPASTYPRSLHIYIRNGWVMAHDAVWNLRTGAVRMFEPESTSPDPMATDAEVVWGVTDNGSVLTGVRLLNPETGRFSGPGITLPAPASSGEGSVVSAEVVNNNATVILGKTASVTTSTVNGKPGMQLTWQPAVWRCH